MQLKGCWFRNPDAGLSSETFRRPQPPVFLQKYCRTNGGRTAVQMGGVLQYKWEAYCGHSLSSKLRSQESVAIQMGGVLPYKLEVYCRTFQISCRGWGFRNIAHFGSPNGALGSPTGALFHCLTVGHSPGFKCIGPRGASRNIGLGRT